MTTGVEDGDREESSAAAAVLHFRPRSRAGRTALFLLVHWGYGSAVGAAYPALRTGLRSRPQAAAIFYFGCQMMAMTLFPTLGGTPPPWLWRRSVLLSSLAQHAIYAATVCAAERALVDSEARRTDPMSPTADAARRGR